MLVVRYVLVIVFSEVTYYMSSRTLNLTHTLIFYFIICLTTYKNTNKNDLKTTFVSLWTHTVHLKSIFPYIFCY